VTASGDGGLMLAQTAWRWDFAWDHLPTLLWAGLRFTITLTLLGTALAMVLGLVWAVLRRSRFRLVSWPVYAFTEFVRRTPIIVQLFFVRFTLPGYGIRLSAYVVGVIVLGIHYSAYTAEVYRAGIEAIRRAQWEAAVALNLGRRDTWVRVVLPQAIPPVIPALGNYVIAMFKDVPQVAFIGVLDIFGEARAITSRTFRAVEMYTIVGAFFMAVSYPSALLVRRLERRFGRAAA
jgi:polar amino acid transport system permease protein